MQRLTLIQMQSNQLDKALNAFSTLQGQLKSQQIDVSAIDSTLYQLYNHYCMLRQSQTKTVSNANNLVSECNQAMITFKQDQEDMIKLSQDRLRLVGQLRESTDFSLELLEQNKQLKQMMEAMQRLNDLLNTRHAQMEVQLSRLIQKQKSSLKSQINGLQKDYQAMFETNENIKTEMQTLGKKAEMLQQLSLPIRVIKIAFNSNRSLRELVMRQAESELGSNADLRDIFMNCQFELGQPKK